jgi:serine O-acetyltransferase
VLNLFVVYLKHRQLKYANCHISYEAIIGFNLNLPHPVGIVIGKGVKIEDNVTIYQNSTIGQKENNKYPLIKEYTTIYPNSIIVGDIVLGNHSIVGAHSYVDKSIGSGEIYFNKR